LPAIPVSSGFVSLDDSLSRLTALDAACLPGVVGICQKPPAGDVSEIWTHNPRSFVAALIFQTAFVAPLLFIQTARVIPMSTRNDMAILLNYPRKISRPKASGTAGGPHGSPTRTVPPLRSLARAFVAPPSAGEHPVLAMPAPATEDMSVAPPFADGSMTNPLGTLRTGSNGGDFGPGHGTGGTGIGPGGGGQNADVFTIGGVTTPPAVLSKVDPEYSGEARKAKYSGSVLLSVVVNTDGRPDNIRVMRSLGMGLDEKAIEAVKLWRFRPGVSHGIPVRVRAQIEVSFRLL
jgi:TonB family protein